MRKKCLICGEKYLFKHICKKLNTIGRSPRVSPIEDDSMDILLQTAVVNSIISNDSPPQEDNFKPGGGTFGGAGASGGWTEPPQERETVQKTVEADTSDNSSDSSTDCSSGD